MAGGWVKSLHCKSSAFDDVFSPSPKRVIPGSASCRSITHHSINDVVKSTSKLGQRKPKPPPPPPSRPKPGSGPTSAARAHRTASSRQARVPDPFLPAMTELPPGHPSRNVVEIIFRTSWSREDFSGRVEMILKVQNGSRTVGRFEKYREEVKARAGSVGGCDNREENVRCAADGNEVMRFHCLGATSWGGGGWTCGGAGMIPGGKGAAICTYSESGAAHENGGGGSGRKGMLVCRVIAGRVSAKTGYDPFDDQGGSDSVSGDNGELLVLDSRAVLPCFLIIYRR